MFKVKIDYSKLSQGAIDHFFRLFLEAKWFYNYCLSHDNVNDSDTTVKSVPVKVGNKFEVKTFVALSSQMKQAIKTRLFNSLSSLRALRKNGWRIGRLKFKNRMNSIPLKQFRVTFDLDRDRSRIRLQGWRFWLKVRGFRQIPEEAEIANATLVRKASGYYLHITTYMGKQKRDIPEASIGIDFGCQTQMTFSNGVKAEFQVPASKRLRRLDRKIMRNGRPDSKKRRQDQAKRRRELERLANRKRDLRHKVVSAITKSFSHVCVQDENIKGWKASGHGKKIQNSGIGGIISDLKHKSVTPVVVDRFFPSTQLCPECGKKNKVPLAERMYGCSCGYEGDRDIKAAICIEAEGMKTIPAGRREFTAGETLSSAFFDTLSKINGVKTSKTGR